MKQLIWPRRMQLAVSILPWVSYSKLGVRKKDKLILMTKGKKWECTLISNYSTCSIYYRITRRSLIEWLKMNWISKKFIKRLPSWKSMTKIWKNMLTIKLLPLETISRMEMKDRRIKIRIFKIVSKVTSAPLINTGKYFQKSTKKLKRCKHFQISYRLLWKNVLRNWINTSLILWINL